MQGLVTEIEQNAPDVQVVVTSRQRLQIPGETVVNLTGMDVVKWRTVDEAREYAAVQLLLHRATRVYPRFELTEDNLPAVTRICQLVEGLPLGIVLAAGWLGMLSVDEVCEEIADNVDFLQSAGGDVVERQHSIRAVFDATWAMLTNSEQQAFMKLSVFRGGFTRQAAQAITGADLKTLISLMNKAIISRDADTGRYAIHELLRQFAQKILEATGELEAARDEHSAYFAGLLFQHESGFKGCSPATETSTNEVTRAIQSQFRRSRSGQNTPIYILDPLTRRETEVLEIISRGMSNHDTARELGISIATVKTHLNRVFGKLGVNNRTQAIIRARALGLLTENTT